MARADRTAVAAGALLIVVGLLITAVEGRTTAGSGVVGALGFLPLGLLLLWRSNGDAAPFVAGVGTLTFSVGYAMSSNAMEVAGQVSAGLLEAVGAAAVTGSVIGARPREYLWTGAWRAPYQRSVIGGLLTLILAFVASAIVSGVVYSGNATLTDIRVGPAIAYALECAGVAMLGWAAGWRVFLANRAQHTR